MIESKLKVTRGLHPCTEPVRLLLLLLLCVASVGCSGRLATYPVQGKVQFVGGAPVRVGTVELKSLDHAVQARGEIQEDGSFTLSTFADGDGAVAGKHACVVVQFVMLEEAVGHRPSKMGVIAPRYSSYATSGLSIEVLPQSSNDVVIEVEGVLKKQPEGEHKHP